MPPTLQSPPTPDYCYLTDADRLASHLQPYFTSPHLAIDTETTGLDPHRNRIRLLQLAIPKHPILLIDLFTIAPNALDPLRTLLAAPIRKLGHHLQFDWQFLQKANLPLAGPYYDTHLAYRVWCSGRKRSAKLQAVVAHLLHWHLDKTAQTSDFSQPQLTTTQLTYAALDVAVLLPLAIALQRQLKAASNNRAHPPLTRIATLESQCLSAIAEIELSGITLDRDRWQHIATTLQTQQHQAWQTIQTLQSRPQQLTLLDGITPGNALNPNSPTQVKAALQAIGISVTATDQRHLVPIADQHPAIAAILDYRSRSRTISIFEQNLVQQQHPITGRLHPRWFQIGSRSGRCICKHPPLQTIPRDPAIRACFVAAPGHCLVRADYSQIELRIVAKLTSDRHSWQAPTRLPSQRPCYGSDWLCR